MDQKAKEKERKGTRYTLALDWAKLSPSFVIVLCETFIAVDT